MQSMGFYGYGDCLAGQSSANSGNEFSHRLEQTFFLASWLAVTPDLNLFRVPTSLL